MPDRDSDLTGPNGRRIADFDRGKIFSRYLHNREIVLWVASGNLTSEFPTVSEDDIDLVAGCDVTICDDLPVGSPDHPGAIAALVIDHDDRLLNSIGDFRQFVREQS